MAIDRAASKRDDKARIRAASRQAADRDGNFFVALPIVVIDSPGYRRAGKTSRALLVDMASQLFRPGDSGGLPNGGLMVGSRFMKRFDWPSKSTLARCLEDLQRCGLIVVTRRGGKRVAGLYAVTWKGLDTDMRKYPDLDIDARAWASAHRGAYTRPEKPAVAPQVARTAAATAARRASAGAAAVRTDKNRGPSDGQKVATFAPSDGAVDAATRPADGPATRFSATLVGPSDGPSIERHHLGLLSEARLRPRSEVVTHGPDPEEGS